MISYSKNAISTYLHRIRKINLNGFILIAQHLSNALYINYFGHTIKPENIKLRTFFNMYIYVYYLR